MNQFTTDIVDALVKKQDITEVFRSHLETSRDYSVDDGADGLFR